MAGSVVSGGLPPLLPTPRGCIGLTPPPASYVSRKRPGRATLSESWVKDKLAGGGVSSYRSKVGGGGESADWNGSKRAASRFEKKAKLPTDEDEDVLDLEMPQYAGPTFSLSPDPSQLPIPFLFMKAH